MRRKLISILLVISLCVNITACSNKADATITSAGTYSISGKLDDGQIIVNAGDEDKVYLILNGVDITCLSSAPIYVMNAKKSIISVADDTRGKDCINITDGNITVNAKSDGMKSNNDEDASKGYVYIEGGKISITAGEDGIQAKTQALIANGNIIISSGGGSANSSSSESEKWGQWGMPDKNVGDKMNPNVGMETGIKPEANTETTTTEESISEKAIKAGSNIIIQDGNINIDSSDDSIH